MEKEEPSGQSPSGSSSSSSGRAPVLAVQRALRSLGVDGVVSKYMLICKSHRQHSNLLLFKYRQEGSPFGEEVVQECRGIVLDMDDDWAVVAYPYRKFFNYGERWAASVDWSSAAVVDKLDGSLATLYWYRGQWHVASSGVPDASAILSDSGQRFCDLFWRVWRDTGMSLPEDKRCCYMFELLSRDNVIVNRVEHDAIVLHGVRDLTTLRELAPAPLAERYRWPLVQTRPYHSLQEVIDAAKLLDPALHEGFVVCDQNFNRVKVKAPQYVALSLMNVYDSKSLNYNHMTKIVRAHEGSEFLVYFPQYESLYKIVASAFSALRDRLAIALDKLRALLAPGTNGVNAVEVRLHLNRMMDIKHSAAMDTFADLVLDVLRKPEVTLDKALEAAAIDPLVVLLHQMHSPQVQAQLTRYKNSLPKRKRHGSSADDGEDEVEVPTPKFEIEYDVEPYEKPSIARAKAKLKEQQEREQQQAKSIGAMSSGNSKKKGARETEWEVPEKLSRRAQRQQDVEFTEALAMAKAMDETGTRTNYNPPPGKGGRGGKGNTTKRK